jgi:hypothetical protein
LSCAIPPYDASTNSDVIFDAVLPVAVALAYIVPTLVCTVPEAMFEDCVLLASDTPLSVGGVTSKLLTTVAVTGSRLVTLHVKV